MPALLTRMSRRPNFSAAPLTKARHAASVPTSACVKATLAPAASSSAATRWPRSPSRSQNATLAPSATKRLTVASPIPDAPPVTAATLPSSLPMFATFHCIAKRASTIRRIHPARTALLARPDPRRGTSRSAIKNGAGAADRHAREDRGRRRGAAHRLCTGGFSGRARVTRNAQAGQADAHAACSRLRRLGRVSHRKEAFQRRCT